MRTVSFYLVLICFYPIKNCHAQIQLFQPKEEGEKKNILFGQHKHYFKVGGKEKLLKVIPSIGNVFEQTDSSFIYYLNAPLTSGKVRFAINYSQKNEESVDTMVYSFMPKTRYTCMVLGLSYNSSNLYRVSARRFKEGTMKLLIYKDNELINAKINCLEIVYVPKRGDGVPPILITSNKNLCEEFIKAGYTNRTVRRSLNEIKPKYGDRIFIERAVISLEGQPKLVQLGTSLQITK